MNLTINLLRILKCKPVSSIRDCIAALKFKDCTLNKIQMIRRDPFFFFLRIQLQNLTRKAIASVFY